MSKRINFNQEHLDNLENLALTFLFDGTSFKSQLGVFINVYDLIHNSTIVSLQSMYNSLQFTIRNKENTIDNWSCDEESIATINLLKKQYDFINLLIGYKKWKKQEEDLIKKRLDLQKEIELLEKSTLTPQEQILAKKKELEDLK